MDFSSIIAEDPWRFLALATRKPFLIPLNAMDPGRSAVQAFIEAKERQLSNAPEGTLVIAAPRRGSSTPECYLNYNGKRTYLPAGQESLAKALAQKEYDQKQLKEEKRLQAQLSRFTDKDLTFHESFGALRSERQALVEPDFLPEETVRQLWKEIKFESLGFSANYPEYFTAGNTRVRSTSERNIGNRLEEREILYFYELPLRLADGGIVYPDFTCLNLRTRRLYLWEHFGRLDDRKYSEASQRKLERYRASGYYLGVDLIASYEAGGNLLTRQELDRLIDTFLV